MERIVDKARAAIHYPAMAAEAAATRHLDRRAARAEAFAAAKADLCEQMARALFEEPKRAVPTPGFSRGAETAAERLRLGAMPAIDVLFDDLDGASPQAAELREAIVRVLGTAAMRGDVLAQLIVSVVSSRYALFHAADAVAIEEDGEE